MSKQIILILLLLALINCQPPQNFHLDDADEDIFPAWKLRLVLRDNGQACYEYDDACHYVCGDKCQNYSGDNADKSLIDYKYCCPRLRI